MRAVPKTTGRDEGQPIRIASITMSLTLAAAFLLFVPYGHASSKDDRVHGAVLFHERGCEHCHGVDAVGTDRGPNLSGVGRWLLKPDIALQIRNGGKTMPAFGDALNDDEVKQLVAFLAAKKKKGVPRPTLTNTKN